MSRYRHHAQYGHALLMTLIITAVLTMLALLSVRTLSLNLRISGNYGAQQWALEASERARSRLGPVVCAHTRSRGWPQRWGGDSPDSAFADLPAGLSLTRDHSGALRNWSLANSEAITRFDPLLLDEDAQFSRDDGSSVAPLPSSASLAVYRLHAMPLAGGNLAAAQAYEGTGASSAAGGSALLYYLHSEAHPDGSEARALTGAFLRCALLP